MLPLIAKAAPMIANVASKKAGKSKDGGDKKAPGKKSPLKKIGKNIASNNAGTMGNNKGGMVNLGTWGGK